MKMKYKLAALSACLAAALFLGIFAMTGGAKQRDLPVSSSVDSALPVENLSENSSAYILREVEGSVAVFSGGALWRKTDISAELLRERDRQALQEGIRVESLEELLKLIEDFNS